jgi:AcrR family transcriptional regulator
MKNENSKRRQEAERAQRREHILAAAERVFGRKGFDESSMQDIAVEAGIGMQGMYAHFPSKQLLFEEAVLRRIEEVRRRTASAVASHDPWVRLRELAVAYAAHFLERPQFFPLWASQKLSADWHLQSRFSETIDRPMHEATAEVAAVLKAAVKVGLLRPLDPRLLTGIVLGVFHAVVEHFILHEKESTPEACAEQMMQLAMHGLAVPS